MITGNTESKIEKYIFIDRCAGGYGFVIAEPGEEIVGIPYQWHSDNSMPFIEHRRQITGEVVKTVNAIDVSEIIFKRSTT